MALNRLENDHPLPLIFFYRSQVEQGRTPTALALRGMSRASELAPFDLGLRLTLALALFQQGQKDEGRAALTPVAYNPHGGGMAAAARKLLTKAESEPNWDGKNATSVLASAAKEAAAEESATSGTKHP